MALPLLTTLLQTAPDAAATITATLTPTATVQVDPSIFKPLPGMLVPSQVIALIIVIALVVGVPVLLIRRFGVPMRNLLWGAIVGFAVQSVLAPLLVQVIAGGIGIPSNPDRATTFGVYLFNAVVLGLLMTVGYFIIYQFILRYDEEHTWAGALMTGAGAAAVIAVVNSLLSGLSNMAFFLQWPPSADLISKLDDTQRRTLPETANQVAQLSGWEPLVRLFFDVIPLLLLLVSAVLVMRYFQTRDWQWLALSFGLLFIGYGAGVTIDYFLSDSLGTVGTSIVAAVVYLGLAVLAGYLAMRAYTPPDIKAKAIVAAPVVTSTEEQLMSDHPELETPKTPKRRRRR